MKKLMKRRICSYRHPTGMEVKGYVSEVVYPSPRPRPVVSAPANNARGAAGIGAGGTRHRR